MFSICYPAIMATRSISLTDPQADRRARKLERLKAAIQHGLDDMEAGRFEVVKDIRNWLDGRGRRKPAG